jgi:Domain of unknown function (DUF4598)
MKQHTQPHVGNAAGRVTLQEVKDDKLDADGRPEQNQDEIPTDETSGDESEGEIESTSSEGSDSDEETDKGGDLKSRLAAFLPQMREANQNLGSAAQIDDISDDEQHIEMDLSLGVLEEKNKVVKYRDTSSDESDEEPQPKKRKIEDLS